MFKSKSTSLILLGILAVIVGIIAIAWPGVTILALVILFAIYAFMDAGLQAARAFSSRSAGPVLGHLLLALISLAAGVVALVWPGPTAFVLVIVVAAWALVGGVVEIVAGFGSGETAGTRALFIVSGLVSVAFGILLFARPGVGAVTLALLFGLYSMIYGFSQITAGVQVRQLASPSSRSPSCGTSPEPGAGAWAWAPGRPPAGTGAPTRLPVTADSHGPSGRPEAEEHMSATPAGRADRPRCPVMSRLPPKPSAHACGLRPRRAVSRWLRSWSAWQW